MKKEKQYTKEKFAPVKWAKKFNLDPDLFTFWNSDGVYLSESEFFTIAEKVCSKEKIKQIRGE